jgi:hypothetical protein
MATVKEIIEKAYTKVNGEYEAMVESDDDFKTYLNVLNQVMEQWAHTPYVKWQSLFDMNYTLPGVVVDGQFLYPFASGTSITIGNTPFDSVYFVGVNGVVVEKYKMTDQALFDASNVPNICSLVSGGLRLKSIPTTIIGTSIRLPVYATPALYTTASQTVTIDSVPWLVISMAAFICDASPVPFIARNAEKYAKEATNFMKEMRDNNRHRQHLTVKKAGQTMGQNFANLSQAINAGVGIGGGGGSSDSIDGGAF